jgi:hypothetical protein
MLYKYDQLNRIKQQDAYDFATGIGVPTINNAYQMKLTYDANGNILTLLRNANAANFEMDELKYSYYNYNPVTGISNDAGVGGTFNCNRLAHVHDDSPIGNIFTDDIETQGNDNYTYDAIGNLIKDNAEGISQIDWNLQNKISKIQKANLTLAYEYDPTGKRIIKTNIRPGQPDTASVYVLDPQGNTLAIYRLENSTLTWQEQHLYGSSRIGITREEKPIARLMKTGGIGSGGTGSLQQGSNFDLLNGIQALGTIQALSTYRAQTEYELTNHLGNVLATVSDAKQSTNQANMLSYTDYYAFGMAIPGRQFNGNGYRYGMNTQEKDIEVGEGIYTAAHWEYDSRIGRRWNLDPKPTVGTSYYACFLNSPIMVVDPDGDEVKYAKFRDRVNAFFGRRFNKEFRGKFKKWDESSDIYTLTKSKEFGSERLVKADVCEGACNNGIQDNAVYYNKGFTTNDISSKRLRLAALPFDIAFNIGKLPIALGAGFGIGIHNIFSDKKHDIGWGWGNRMELGEHNSANLLSWGFGNFNKYNMFGQSLSGSGFGNKKLHPDGFLGFRWGIGKLKVNFFDIGPDGGATKEGNYYHAHFNIAGPKTRRAEMHRESGVDFKQNR